MGARRRDLHYVGVVLNDADDEFSVHFPDLPGCFTGGAARAQACRFAVETLTAHLERFTADRVPLPMIRCLEAIWTLPAQSRATLMLLEASLLTGRPGAESAHLAVVAFQEHALQDRSPALPFEPGHGMVRPRDPGMPLYEYVCRDRRHGFEALVLGACATA